MFNYSTGNLFLPFCIACYIAECRLFHGLNLVITCSLLLRRECCSFSNGEYVKTGLAELEQWCVEATEEVSTKQLIQIVYFSILQFLPQSIVCTVLWLSLGGTETYQAGSWIPGNSQLSYIFKINSILISNVND